MRRIFGFQIALGLVSLSVFLGEVPGVRNDAHAQCAGNQPITRLATGCAVAWDNSDHHATEASFNPWNATSMDPDDEPEKKDRSRMVALNGSMCRDGSVRLHTINPANHLALVQCTGASSESRLLWVSLDSLACDDHNVLTQTDLLAPAATSCPPVSGSPGEGLASEVAPLQHHALTDLQQNRLNSIHHLISTLDERSRDDSYNILDKYFTLAETPDSSPSVRAAALVRLRAMVHNGQVRLTAISERLTRPRAQGGYGPDCDQPLHSENVDIVHGQSVCEMTKLGLRLANELDSIPSDESLAERIENYKHGIRMNDEYLRLRIALFNGYTDQERAQLVSSGKVQLARRASEINAGPLGTVYDLHDGYVYGGHRNSQNGVWAYDCSDFAASVIGERSGAPTTYDLRNIALSIKDPAHAPQLSAMASRYASCFSLVDLRAGQEPQPLDLVVSRNDLVGYGHVVMVDDFDRSTGEIIDFEAHGAPARRVGRFRRPLYEENVCQAPAAGGVAHGPPPRPDIFVLRLKSKNVPGCPINLEGS